MAVLAKLKWSLGLAFNAHFLHDFSIKMFCILYSINGQSFNVTPYFFLKINYSTSICPFESGKCGKEVKKLQKFEYLKNKKSFLDEIKNIFHSF